MTARTWLLAAGMVCVASVAHAQSVCHQHAEFVTELGRKYLEAPIAYGLTSTGQVIEVLASGNGSWTMIITSTDGTTCAVAAGESWSKVPGERFSTPYYIF